MPSLSSKTSRIWVSHNAEIAHRLSLLPGKCQNIHGHSLDITLFITGELNDAGILEGLDFGSVKKAFRGYIDEFWDHKLHLNKTDEWAQILFMRTHGIATGTVDTPCQLPGLMKWNGDPTTENIAKWILAWAILEWPDLALDVRVQETNSNGASCENQ
jgi:6-pyruvoyl-tetrahydropterin synthase